MRFTLFLLVLASISDVLSTLAVLRAGGRELNPLYGTSRPSAGVLWGVKIVTCAMCAVALSIAPEMWWLVAIVAVFLMGVSLNNWRVYRKMRSR